MTSHDIIRQIQDCELEAARDALLRYRYSDTVARKAYYIMVNVTSGRVANINNSVGHVIKMLWNHELVS